MADSTFVRAVAPDLSCPVCLEMFIAPHIPKDLPNCSHVCCEVCLNNLIKQNRRVCPECRKTVTIPKGGVSQLRTNLKIQNFAEKFPKRPCEAPGDTEEPICVEHDDAKMRYFCASCSVLACQACLLLKHKGDGHDTKKVAERYKEIQLLTNECQKVVDEYKVTCRTIKSTVEEKARKQKKEVDDSIGDEISQIRKVGKEIKDQIDASKTLILKELDQKITYHANLINSIEKLKLSAEESAGSIPEADYVLRYSSLQQKLGHLKVEGSRFEASVSPVSAKHTLTAVKSICVGDMEPKVIPGQNQGKIYIILIN